VSLMWRFWNGGSDAAVLLLRFWNGGKG
jgi:hypothetical protein